MVYSWSKTGTYHLDKCSENQDVIALRSDDRYTVISLADGVSSCSHARAGASIASTVITNLFFRNADIVFRSEKKQITEYTLSNICHALADQASVDGSDITEYSSTLASVLIDHANDQILSFNLGDGIIIGVKNGCCKILSIPSNSLDGCCVTTTKGAALTIDTKVINGSFDSIWICSDGCWREIFTQNKLNPAIETMLVEGDYNALTTFLIKKCPFDDCSFVVHF